MDEEVRRELLRRRDEDRRVRHLVSFPKGQYMIRLRDEVAEELQRVDEDNTRWLGDLLTTRGWPGQMWSARTEPRQRSCSPSTPTALLACSRHFWTICAARSPRAKHRPHTWPT